ncbi:MAG: tonB-system energizer ExbB, partial [Bradyrhizobium icense]
MFRTVLKLAAMAAIVLASPALAQQQPAPLQPPAAQQAPVQAAPAATQAAPAASAPAAAVSPAAGASTQLTISVPKELSPWSMFMTADVVVKAVMIGL